MSLYHLPTHKDSRGNLTVGEFSELPFYPKRFFIVHGANGIRGNHAHYECEHFMICVNGEVTLILDDGNEITKHLLTERTEGVYIPAMVWDSQYDFSEDAVVLVFASEPYEPDDYITSYEDFKNEIQ